LVGETGDQVVNVDKLTYAGTLTSVAEIAGSPNYSFVQADIADRAAIKAIFDTHKPDAVLHLAAESHVDSSIVGAGPFIETNIVGTYVMLDCALDYWRGLSGDAKAAFRFVHVSTDEVYGSLGADGLFEETTPYAPTSPYSSSKAAADHLALAWWHTYGLPVLVSNCSNNYGPYHFPEKLIPLMILNGLDRRPLPVYGDGSNIRDWLFVEDHARALRTILKTGRPAKKHKNGASAQPTNLQVVHANCDLQNDLAPTAEGSDRDVSAYVTDSPGHDHRYAIDATKLETELGWTAREDFESGIRKTVEWYLARADWWEPLRAEYDGRRLGLLNAKAG